MYPSALAEVIDAEEKATIESNFSAKELAILNRFKTSKETEDEWEKDYIRKPPTILEFIEDEYWLGRVLKPSEGQGLFPAWRGLLSTDFDLDSKIHNLVITGSLGTGKTYTAVIILLYKVVLATLLKNPQTFFGLGPGSAIVYNILSVTKAVVQQTALHAALNFMAYSQYFLVECGYQPDMKYTNFKVPLRNNIFLTAGSKGWHVIGQNVCGVLLDEGNWRNEAEPDTRAYELYNEVRLRISNRFMKLSGFLPAISILASSAKDESSFTETVIKEIENANDPTHQLVYRHSVYNIKRHELKLSDRWFRVAYGMKNVDPIILRGWYTEDGVKISSEEPHEDPPQGASVELVPENYYPEFKRRPRTALQSVCGISTGGSHRLFSSMLDFEKCIELGTADGVVNPCKADFLPISMEDDKNIWDYLLHKTFLTRVQSVIQPRRHPQMLRYAHIDLATTSMAGVSVCHLVGSKRVDGLMKSGQLYSEYRLIVEYDFILAIVAGKTKNISIEKIQNFFFWLADYGYRFGKITADQWQSAMPLQMLEARGYPTGLLPIDRDKSVYHAWRTGFEELRIRLFHHSMLTRDAENLLELDKKIDHPKDGMKDVSDSASGAYFNAITSEEKATMMLDNHPSVYLSPDRQKEYQAENPITIALPLGMTRVKSFQA